MDKHSQQLITHRWRRWRLISELFTLLLEWYSTGHVLKVSFTWWAWL